MFKHSLYYLIIFFGLCLSGNTNASNRLYADNQLEPTQGFDWDWSFGAGLSTIDPFLVGHNQLTNSLVLDLNLALSYNNFYLDIDENQLSGGFIIGYSVVDKYDWGLDIIGSNMVMGFDEDYYYKEQFTPELKGISARQFDFDMGIRLSRRFDDTQISFELLNDISSAHGSWVFNSFLSHIQVFRNWEFRNAIGINLYSQRMTDYYYGVDKDEVAVNRPEYQASNGLSVLVEFNAEYPLTEHWVFMGGMLSTWYSSEITNSPLITQSYEHKAKVGVRYVF